MANDLALTGQIPGVLAGRQSKINQAAQQGIAAAGFASLGYKGKVWSIKYQGEEEIQRDDKRRPLQDLEVVIVAASSYASKSYYEGGYREEKGRIPDCWSVDGIQPDPSVAHKQNALCGDCPNNAWGSAITAAGKKAKACSDRKRLAVVPLGDIENEVFGGPMLLDLPPTSHGNLAEYARFLDRKGACLDGVATRLSFDPEIAYPKIQFEAIGWLSEEQAIAVVGPNGKSGIQTHPAIERMLNDIGAPIETDGPSPLDAPPPAAVQRRLSVVAPVASNPVADPEPEPEPEPEPKPVTPPASPAPATRRRGFTPAATAAAPVAAASPASAATPAARAAPVIVREAPEDMAAAIEAMLASTV